MLVRVLGLLYANVACDDIGVFSLALLAVKYRAVSQVFVWDAHFCMIVVSLFSSFFSYHFEDVKSPQYLFIIMQLFV